MTMDGHRIREYMAAETHSLIERYRHFERLLPAAGHAGAAHTGEDGRYVESLLRMFLRAHLPQGLEVLTGFIMRPAVKIGDSHRREGQTDAHSPQLDLMVVDTAHYSTFIRFEDNVIVPPEAVIAVVSVKKTLHKSVIAQEVATLARVGNLCAFALDHGKGVAGPLLALVSFRADVGKEPNKATLLEGLFAEIKRGLPDPGIAHDHCVDLVTSLDAFSIYKRAPKRPKAGEQPENGAVKQAAYLGFSHAIKNADMPLQLLVSGIFDVFYDPSRGNPRPRPGYTSFSKVEEGTVALGEIPVSAWRKPYTEHV